MADLGFDENGGFAEERDEKRGRNNGGGEEKKQKCEDRDGSKWYDPFGVDGESRNNSFHGGRRNERFGVVAGWSVDSISRSGTDERAVDTVAGFYLNRENSCI